MILRRALALAGALSVLLPGLAAGQAGANESRQDGWIGIRFDVVVGPAGPGRDGAASFEMLVTDVFRGGPADVAGIRAGDRLVPADPVVPYSAWVRSVANAAPGNRIRLRRERDGQDEEVMVVAGRRPLGLPPVPVSRYEGARNRIYATADSMMATARLRVQLLLAGDTGAAWIDSVFFLRNWAGAVAAPEFELSGASPTVGTNAAPLPGTGGPGNRSGQATLFVAVMGGAQLRDMTRGLARHFGAREGVLVTSVAPASRAAVAGFRAGDVVVAAGGAPLASALALRAALQEASTAPLRIDVIRNGARVTLVHPGRRPRR